MNEDTKKLLTEVIHDQEMSEAERKKLKKLLDDYHAKENKNLLEE